MDQSKERTSLKYEGKIDTFNIAGPEKAPP